MVTENQQAKDRLADIETSQDVREMEMCERAKEYRFISPLATQSRNGRTKLCPCHAGG
jgi:hypothetical protein